MSDLARAGELIQMYLDGIASEGELSELETLLVNSPAAADAFATATRFEALLKTSLQTASSEGQEACLLAIRSASAEAEAGPYLRQRHSRWKLVGAAALIAGAALLFRTHSGHGSPSHSVLSGHVLSGDREVTAIPEGTSVTIAGDEPAVIRLSDGSRAEFAPASEAVLRGRMQDAGQVVNLTWGSGRFQVRESESGFRVETPAGSVTALGTEFSVELEPFQPEGERTMNVKAIATVAVVVMVGSVQVDVGGVNELLSGGQNGVFAAEGKVKQAPLPSGALLGFKGKGDMPHAIESEYPGIVGALLLTDEQKQQIQTAREETIDTEEVRAAGRKVKGDPNATEADKQKARDLTANARSQLEQRVTAILTQDQKTLIYRIGAAATEARKVAYDALASELSGAKGDNEKMADLRKQVAEKARAAFEVKMAEILTAEQNAAFQKAAADQKEAEEKAKNSGKSKGK